MAPTHPRENRQARRLALRFPQASRCPLTRIGSRDGSRCSKRDAYAIVGSSIYRQAQSHRNATTDRSGLSENTGAAPSPPRGRRTGSEFPDKPGVSVSLRIIAAARGALRGLRAFANFATLSPIESHECGTGTNASSTAIAKSTEAKPVLFAIRLNDLLTEQDRAGTHRNSPRLCW